MSRKKLPMPSNGEFAILKVLWSLDGATVRQVHETLYPIRPARKAAAAQRPRGASAARATRYTTTLKQLQVMAEKGLVTRDERQRSHIYAPAMSESETLGRVADNVLQRVFDGSARKLLMHALSAGKTSPEELARIRAMLDDIERGGTDDARD